MEMREIVATWLKANGYDGLVAQNRECGCILDALMLCDAPGAACEAGHLVEPTESQRLEDMEWAIAPGKKGGE